MADRSDRLALPSMQQSATQQAVCPVALWATRVEAMASLSNAWSDYEQQ
jgi:hypothetical protein